MKETTFSEVEFTNKKRQTRRDRFLAEVEAVAPWPALVAALLPYYTKGDRRGRPLVGLERMLRMYIAQQCFGLSDKGHRGCDLRQPGHSRLCWHRPDARVGT